jgi:tRNA modification GTPase
MALLPSLRFRYRLFTHSYSLRRTPPTIAALLSLSLPHPHPATPKPISLLLSTLSHKAPVKPHATPKESTLVLGKDERFLVGAGGAQPVENTSATIAAIVTSLGGPPAAVGIVRLSGPSAVAIAGRVFRPARTKKRKSLNGSSSSWRPTSHVVEYGVVSDPHGNVVDEVSFLHLFLFFFFCLLSSSPLYFCDLSD